MTMNTCHEKFERDGNPWLTERERKSLQASLLPMRGGRRYAVPKLPFTDPPVHTRPLTDAEKKHRMAMKNAELVAQLTGCKPRTLKPLGPGALKGIMTEHKAPARVELGMDRASIEAEAERQERQWKQWLAQEKKS